MRYETISKGGYSFFHTEAPSKFAFALAVVVLDHKEKKVLKGPLPDLVYADVVLHSHISESVRLRAEDPRPITLEEWKGMRGNSYETELLIPKLDLACLVHQIKTSILPNCRRMEGGMPSSYDEGLVHSYVPALLKLLEAKDGTQALEHR